jgi:hypothetical protein
VQIDLLIEGKAGQRPFAAGVGLTTRLMAHLGGLFPVLKMETGDKVGSYIDTHLFWMLT